MARRSKPKKKLKRFGSHASSHARQPSRRSDEQVLSFAQEDSPVPETAASAPQAAPSNTAELSPPLPVSMGRSPSPSNPLSRSLTRIVAGRGKQEPPPAILSFDVPMRLSGSPNQWMAALSDLGFTAARAVGGRLDLQAAESLDLAGQPHQFIRISMSPSGAQVQYTQTTGQHPARRKLQALQMLMLTLSASNAVSSQSQFARSVADGISAALELTDTGTDTLKLQSESLEKQVRELTSRLRQLEAQRELDARRQVDDAHSIQTLQERLTKLETLPDSALAEELMEWLRAHDGAISVGDFSRHSGVAHARVEDMLDRLCKAGRIQRVND